MRYTYEVWPETEDAVVFTTEQLGKIENLAARADAELPEMLDYRVFVIPQVSGFEARPPKPLRSFLRPVVSVERPLPSVDEAALLAEGCLPSERPAAPTLTDFELVMAAESCLYARPLDPEPPLVFVEQSKRKGKRG